jgi:hypothetical protein
LAIGNPLLQALATKILRTSDQFLRQAFGGDQ